MAATFLDTNNFTIDSSSWSLQDAEWVVNGKHISIKVKVNPEEDIREYVSWMPTGFIGQQLFTYTAALRETQKVGKFLPQDQSILENAIATMSGDTEIQKYKNYLTKAAVNFAGCYSSWLHVFDDIGVPWFYRLDDWTRLNLNADTRGVARRDESMWYSVRVG